MMLTYESLKVVSEEEDVTREEIQEERDFIDACVDTKVTAVHTIDHLVTTCIGWSHLVTFGNNFDPKVMAMAQEWLVSKGLIADDKVTFKRFLHRMWFALYPRSVTGFRDSI